MKGFTHGGVFHADDVFATALLQIVYEDFEVIRGNAVPENFEGIVYDIGGGKFDHHQEGAPVRENGVPYAAFGLLWREYGEDLVGAENAKEMDEDFVQMIDHTDNTGKMNPLSKLIKQFNPDWKEEISADERFFEVVKYAKIVLERKISCLKAETEKKEYLKQAQAQCNGRILVLDRYVSTRDRLNETEIQYVIYPSARDGYNISIAQSRTPGFFPKNWLGLAGEELEKESGISGLIFCHKAGFLAAADSKDTALRAARFLLELRANAKAGAESK